MWPRRRPATPRPRPLPVALPEAPEQLLRRLRWSVLRPLGSRLGGDERSALRAPGIEFSALREYQPGDDVRLIDWNVSARAQQTFVRESQAERALDAWLLVDLSASIDWGTAACLKRERAVELAAVASLLLAQHGNRVGALLFAEQPLGLVPPGAGRAQLLHLLSRVRDEPPRHGAGPTDLAAALTRLEAIARRRSLVLVLSDFLVADGWQPVLGRLARRHEVVAARLRDPREEELPDIGVATFEDPETGEQLVVDTGRPALRARFRAMAAARAERIRLELARRGVEELRIGTDADLLPALTRFLLARRWRRGGGRPAPPPSPGPVPA